MKHPTKAERRKIGRLIRRGKVLRVSMTTKSFRKAVALCGTIRQFNKAMRRLTEATKKANEAFQRFSNERKKINARNSIHSN